MSPSVTEAPILLLGGTAEARELAQLLVSHRIPVVSSLAGRVSEPRLPAGDTRIGGFGGVDGLGRWVTDHRATAIVDATHPFATGMTAHAAAVADRLDVPLLRLRRPAWSPTAQDRWQVVADMAGAAEAVRVRTVGPREPRVFVTTGRQDVAAFADVDDAWFLIRVVDPPTGALPPKHRILSSRGPYEISAERQLLGDNAIDVVVTKNSGGEHTRAKLRAAAELGIDVVMVARPAEPAVGDQVDSVDEALAWIMRRRGIAAG